MVPTSLGEPAVNYRHDFALSVPTAALEPGMAVPVDAFLNWVEREEGKYEYDRGTIGMMVKVTQNHAVLGARFVVLLAQQLDPEQFQVVAEAFAVRVGRSVRFPDVLVQAAGQDGGSLESEKPVLIVEVLSPASVYLDHVVKLDEYLALPTLGTYLVADPDAPRLTIWERQGQTGAFADQPVVIEGLEREIRLEKLGVSLRLRDLYRGVRFPSPAP